MNILVYGWYGHGNVGDESFKLAFMKIYPQHTFTFCNKITKDHIDGDFDICIIGGGDIINSFNLLQIKKLKCVKIAMSVTITKNSIVDELPILDFIYVRDHLSLQVLKDHGYTKCEYIPDVALVLEGNKENGIKLIDKYFLNSSSDRYENVCTLVMNAHFLGGEGSGSKNKNTFFKHIDDLVEVLDSTNMSFIIIPFSTQYPWDDRVPNSYLNSQCKYWKKNCVVFDTLSIQDTIDIIAASNLLISSRFHGLIFSLSTETPSIMISSHDKTTGFLKTIGQPALDYWNFTTKGLKDAIANVNLNKETIQQLKKDLLKYNEIRFLQRG